MMGLLAESTPVLHCGIISTGRHAVAWFVIFYLLYPSHKHAAVTKRSECVHWGILSPRASSFLCCRIACLESNPGARDIEWELCALSSCRYFLFHNGREYPLDCCFAAAFRLKQIAVSLAQRLDCGGIFVLVRAFIACRFVLPIVPYLRQIMLPLDLTLRLSIALSSKAPRVSTMLRSGAA